ncbi:MAG TPA: TolC family protein, partial [Nostocaceae cyanobacterium]|nr:TolC family protein [Nostocaceae cyanobacterium]
MKGQQLFHTFLPGVTAAVLTTQPALASTVKISGVQLVSPPKVVTSTDGRNLVTNGAMAQHPPEDPATTANVTQTPEEQHSVHSNQPGFQSGSDVATPTFSVKGYGNSNGGSLTSTQQTKDCSKQAQQSRDALLLKPNTCLQKITSVQQIAQATDTPAPATPTPAGATEFTTPAPRGYTTLPENLKPNANPLLYPTKPEEVTIQANQPITLDQAVEIAQRNNNELQVSILELKRSQSALREQQAALFPDLQISADVTNSRSVGSSLSVDRAKNTDPNISDAPSDTSFSGQAQLNYNLYTSGRRLAAIREAEETVRFQELAVENKAEDIRLDVATRYYDLQQADEQVRIS